LSRRAELVDRIKQGPGWLRGSLRAALHGWKRIEPATIGAVRWLPRTIMRARGERRVLGVWHLQEHAGHLGDMVDFLEILNVLRVLHNLEKIDLCYIDDPSNPNQPISRRRIDASPEYKQMMLELRVLLPNVGSTHHFDSDADFERFFRSNFHRYVCWPRYGRFHTWPTAHNYFHISDRGYPFPNTFTPLDRFFASRGELPKLTCPPGLLQWARDFVRSHVAPAVPIVVQLRFNADSPSRNTDEEAWTLFMKRMEARTEFKFVVISRREEMIPQLRELKNIVYSKDYASGVMNDLALILVSHFSMFPDAGFVTFPWFYGLPTIFLGKLRHEFPHRRMNDENGAGLRFLTPFQRRRYGSYDAEILEREFWSLWNDLAAVRWKNPYSHGGA